MNMQQKFIAMIAAGELHVFIIDGLENVQGLAESDMVRNLGIVMDELAMLDRDLHDYLVPLLVPAEYVSPWSGDWVSGMYGIPLQGSPLMESLGIRTQDLYLCKVITVGYDFPTAQAVKALFETRH
jgi:hypothetical protein